MTGLTIERLTSAPLCDGDDARFLPAKSAIHRRVRSHVERGGVIYEIRVTVDVVPMGEMNWPRPIIEDLFEPSPLAAKARRIVPIRDGVGS
jgi:hypothetical protein